MPEKTKAKKLTKPALKKTAAKAKKGDAYECHVCGYRMVIDEVCGCAEEHVYLCCDKPMKRSATKK